MLVVFPSEEETYVNPEQRCKYNKFSKIIGIYNIYIWLLKS